MKKLKSEQPAVSIEMKALHVKLLEIVLEQASISEEASKSAGLLVNLNDTMHDKHKTKHAMLENKHKSELENHVGNTAKVQKGLDNLYATHKTQNDEKVEVNQLFLSKEEEKEEKEKGGENIMTTLRRMGAHLKSIKTELGAFEQHAGKTKPTLGNAAGQVIAQNAQSKKPTSMSPTSPGIGFPALVPTNPKQRKKKVGTHIC